MSPSGASCRRWDALCNGRWGSGVYSCCSSRRRHTKYIGDWSSDVCSSDLFAANPDGTVQLRSKGLVRPDKEEIDRKRVVWGKSVDLGGGRLFKKRLSSG